MPPAEPSGFSSLIYTCCDLNKLVFELGGAEELILFLLLLRRLVFLDMVDWPEVWALLGSPF